MEIDEPTATVNEKTNIEKTAIYETTANETIQKINIKNPLQNDNTGKLYIFLKFKIYSQFNYIYNQKRVFLMTLCPYHLIKVKYIFIIF